MWFTLIVWLYTALWTVLAVLSLNMSSTPSKIPTFGSKPARQVRESKSATSTPLSKDARRDASRKSGPATPKSEARKPRGAPASLSASSTPLSVASSSSLSSKPQQGNSARELSVSSQNLRHYVFASTLGV